MSLTPLDNLVKTGQLKNEPFNQQEFDGLVDSGQKRLKDSKNIALSYESRFDLAALRRHDYRSANRYLVFQALQHTVGAGPEL